MTGEYQSFVTGESYMVPTPVRGSLRKSRITNEPLDDLQQKILVWAWSVGERDKKKTIVSSGGAIDEDPRHI